MKIFARRHVSSITIAMVTFPLHLAKLVAQEENAVRQITSAGGDVVRVNGKVREVHLSFVSDEKIESIQFSSLTGFKSLIVGGEMMTDRTLNHLLSIPEGLESIRISSTRLSDKALSKLLDHQKRSLTSVTISRVPITAKSMPAIGQLTELRYLALNNTNIGDDGLKHLTTLAKLESLHLKQSGISDPGLKYVKKLGALRFLAIDGNLAVTDIGLVELHNLKNLRSLGAASTAVTEAGQRAITKALPNVSILKRSKSIPNQIDNETDPNGYWRSNDDVIAAFGFNNIFGIVSQPIWSQARIDKIEEKTAKQINELGGHTYLNESGKVRRILLQPHDGFDEAVFQRIDLSVFKELKSVEVSGAVRKISDLSLNALRTIPSGLEYLDIDFCDITDRGLASLLEKQPTLYELNVYNTPITDQAIMGIGKLKKLRRLRLEQTKITNECLEQIGSLPLSYLNLSHTAISDQGLPKLKSLQSLNTLTIDGTQVSDSGLESLIGLTKLKYLGINSTKVTEKGKLAIKKALPALEFSE